MVKRINSSYHTPHLVACSRPAVAGRSWSLYIEKSQFIREDGRWMYLDGETN